jgi:amidase
MARFVEDLRLVLPIICGPDWQDPAMVPMPLGDPAAVELTRLRAAVHTDNGVVSPTAAIQDTVRRAAQALAEAGVAVEEACPRALERSRALASALAAADGRAWVRRLLARAGISWACARFAASQGCTSVVPARALTELLEDIDQFRSAMLAFIESYDVLLCPVNASPAPPHDTWREASGRARIVTRKPII